MKTRRSISKIQHEEQQQPAPPPPQLILDELEHRHLEDMWRADEAGAPWQPCSRRPVVRLRGSDAAPYHCFGPPCRAKWRVVDLKDIPSCGELSITLKGKDGSDLEVRPPSRRP